MRNNARLIIILSAILAHSIVQAQNPGGKGADKVPDTYLSELEAEDSGLCTLDVDGDGRVEPGTDGALGLQFMSGSGSAKAAAPRGAKRASGEDIATFLSRPDCQKMLDINQDGKVDADTDGKILSRWLNDVRGQQLVEGIQGGNRVARAPRTHVDAGAVDTQLSFYRNPRRQFGGSIPPGATAGIQDTQIKLTSTDSEGAEIKMTLGTNDQGVPVYEVESSGGEVTLALGDPNQYAALLENDVTAAAASEDYFPGYTWIKKLAWFAQIDITSGFNRYPGPVGGDANSDGDGIIVIPPEVYPYAVMLTAKPSFQLMTACSTPQDLLSCGYAGREAVLFVHGYQAGSNITKKNYWGNFPALMQAKGYTPFDFRWSTSARFEDAAADLAFAVAQISARTQKQVHIVAHSFGGLLTRTLLQGLAVNSANVAVRVASVTTLGTPHSGIMDSNKCRDGFGFPKGQDNAIFIKLCGGLPCHEMGQEVFTDDLEAKFFKVDLLAGGHAFKLAKQLNSRTPRIPFQSLIGVTTRRGDNNTIDKGDNLISFQGQRFQPEYSALSTGCEGILPSPTRVDVAFKSGSDVGPFKLTEQYLGDFDKSTDRPNDVLDSDRGGGYRHSMGVSGIDLLELFKPPAENFVACNATAPDSCGHDGFIKARQWIQGNPAARICLINSQDPLCPPPPQECGTLGQALVFETLNWASQPRLRLITTGKIGAASKFNTTASRTYRGYFGAVADTLSANLKRRMWFSMCPGGPPIVQSYVLSGISKSACDVQGSEPLIRWSQEVTPRFPYECKLAPNRTYYLNYSQAAIGTGSGPTVTSRMYRSAAVSGTP